MAIGAIVQQQTKAQASGVSSTSMTLTAAPGLNNSLVLTIYGTSLTDTVTGIAQTGVTWTKQTTHTQVNQRLEQWLGIVTSGSAGTSITVNFSGTTAGNNWLAVREWPNKLIKDVTGSNSSTSTAPATGTITPTAARNALIVADMAQGATTAGPTNGFTALTTPGSNRFSAYLLVTTTSGTYSTDWTLSSSLAWATAYVVYNEDTGGGPGPASKFAVTQQPSAGTNGVVLPTQPTFQIQDASGVPVTTDTRSATVTLNTISGSGTLSGTVTRNAVSGAYNHTDLKVTGTGTFTITISDGSLTSATTASFTVSNVTPSPYLGLATDGTDPGCNIALKKVQTDVAWSGDRRSATRTLDTTTDEGATLPQNYHDITYPTVTGVTRTVTGASPSARATSLQAALNAANPGDEIVLPLGAANITIGTFTLPVKAGADQTPGGNNVVTIRAANINTNIPYGVRVVGPDQALRRGVAATDLNLLAHVQVTSGAGNTPLFDSNNQAAHGYRFVGLYATSDPTVTGTTPVSRIFRLGDGNGTQNSDALVPKNNNIDRCLIRPGHASTQMLHAVDFQVGKSYIIDSDISGFWEYLAGDCQAVTYYNTLGFLGFINNYFSASDEGVIQGGGNNNIGPMVDFENRWNMYDKPDAWNPSHPSWDGVTRSVKLAAEVKHGQRSLWEGCVFTSCWAGTQQGDGINIKDEYNEVGGSHTSDVVIRHCDFDKLDTMVRVAGGTYAPDGSAAVSRVAVRNCLGTNIGVPPNGSGSFGITLQSQKAVGLRMVHVTAIATRIVHYLLSSTGSADTSGVVHRDNIYGTVTYASFRGGGTGDGKASIDAWAPGATLHGNVIAGADSANYSGADLSGNFFPVDNTAIRFAADWSLVGSTQTGGGGGGGATKLGVVTQPGNGTSGSPIPAQPSVEILDASSTRVVSDTSSVTASLVTVTGSGTATGTLTQAAAAGLASFTDLGVTSAGGGTFKWHYTDGVLTSVDSAVFTITAPPVLPGGSTGGGTGVRAWLENHAQRRLEQKAKRLR